MTCVIDVLYWNLVHKMAIRGWGDAILTLLFPQMTPIRLLLHAEVVDGGDEILLLLLLDVVVVRDVVVVKDVVAVVFNVVVRDMTFDVVIALVFNVVVGVVIKVSS